MEETSVVRKTLQYILYNDFSNNEAIFTHPCCAIGVQGLPGTKFRFYYINEEVSEYIIMGPSGIYLLNLPEAIITGIRISGSPSNTFPIIVDVVIEEPEGE